jgi:hypothetical protein
MIGVAVEDDGQPHGSQQQGDLGQRARIVGEREVRPTVLEQIGRQSADESGLQEDVDEAGDEDRSDDGEGHVLLRVRRLTCELHALPEAEVGEDDARGGQGGEDRGSLRWGRSRRTAVR